MDTLVLDPDTRRELWRFDVFVVLCFAFVISGYLCYNELHYLMVGQSTSAKVIKVESVPQQIGSDKPSGSFRIRYQFHDDRMKGGKADRVETDTVSSKSDIPSGDTVNVQYIPGAAENSRIAGHASTIACAPFFVISGMILVSVGKFWKGYRDYERRKAAW